MIGLKGEMRGTKQRKLSESPHTNLHRSKNSSKSSDSSSSSGKKRVTLQNIEQDEVSTDVSELKSIGKAQTLAHSSADYTLSLNHLLDVNSRNGSQQSIPLSSKLDDSLDITIYWADERGLKFSLIGGKFATASSLLLLLADHLGIVADIFKQVCALWMVSDLLEVQLKPHHNPYEIRKNWMQFLQRFTNAESNELVADEPLLVLKRNVQLPVERERELEEDYSNEILTEILYRSAKQEVLNGRYICDIDLNIKLAALQMAIDLEPNEDVDIMNVFGEEIETFFPLKYRHNVKTFHLFGIPIIGCKGLETRILQEYRNIRLNFEGKHSCRKAYLNIIRNTPFYGAAFFRGYVERPSGRPLKEIKRMILSVTLPDIPVLIGISCGYVTLIDEAKQEVLLVQRLHDCDCRYVDDHFEVAISAAVLTECPCFLLTFPDTSFLNDHNLNSETEMLKFSEQIKVLQVFSKQAIMIEALMNSLSKLMERNTEENTDSVISNIKYDNCRQDLEGAVSDNSSPDDRNAYVTNVSTYRIYVMMNDVNKVNHSCDVTCRVWCVQWNHAGTILASCGDDKTIKLWKRIDDAPYLVYSGTISDSHNRAIRYVAFSPNDKFLASAGFDAAIVIHQLCNNDYEEINRLEGHENEVKCCAFSPSGEYLATCSRDKSVWFWQLDENEDFEVASILQSHTQDVKFVVWHPVDELLVSCSYDCSIRFYRFDGEDWITQEKIDNAHKSTIWSADFSDDGNFLVTVGADFIINIWMKQGINLAPSKSKWNKVTSVCVKTKWPLYTVSWNKLHGIIAVGGGDNEIRLFRLNNSKDNPLLEECFGSYKLSSEINCLNWNPVESNLLTGATDDGGICVLRISL